MNNQPKLLNIFSGAVCSEGYKRAGFHVTDVDIKLQPRHSGDVFIQADALEYVAQYGWMFDAIHASPPCQFASQITPDKSKHANLIPQTRYLLESIGVPYVIENVAGARKHLRNPIMLCGTYFGLKVYRHRFFESNVFLLAPQHDPHRDNTPRAGHGLSSKGYISITSGGNPIDVPIHAGAKRRSGVYGISDKGFVSISGHFTGAEYCRWAMGVDRYVTNYELSQAIPPAYTEFIGRQLMAYVLRNREIAERETA